MTTNLIIRAVINHPDSISPEEAKEISVESLQRGVAQLSERMQGQILNIDWAEGEIITGPLKE